MLGYVADTTTFRKCTHLAGIKKSEIVVCLCHVLGLLLVVNIHSHHVDVFIARIPTAVKMVGYVGEYPDEVVDTLADTLAVDSVVAE